MRLLLDESVPRRLARDLTGHEVETVPGIGWASKDNGELLQLATGNFDAFITVDKQLEYQQDVSKFDIAVVILDAPTNRYDDLVLLIPALLEELKHLTSGECVWVAG